MSMTRCVYSVDWKKMNSGSEGRHLAGLLESKEGKSWAKRIKALDGQDDTWYDVAALWEDSSLPIWTGPKPKVKATEAIMQLFSMEEFINEADGFDMDRIWASISPKTIQKLAKAASKLDMDAFEAVDDGANYLIPYINAWKQAISKAAADKQGLIILSE